ncbi:GntR family transcriptional regulator [Solwaraspora sp. WMMD792]|uniref:GntR family transcriptional regulator n=1 Tax=Solwaraspora sp. WMMD792 TaxID=3016099 RepID=UPI002415B498|nr:GntR family transcriptional regulator [Solwaraspora sp. WMMD792]MDG4768740.1 GntR family transcriptional regulator [Solwaraspora sp. WMMD792]MDG4768779.1 GntR family transcriptional regulator [Solwaraspora sp. WMMD792]MDG4768821.1 GntR family transcriptional regulator [Solwaraspora sp. WMMD792]MDG4768866.1 GntR family transcriptional regulator [Solwaraspora sp. WMMD792]MDG4768896.1 GntR family transcriptional regulator [Solwaraspora sp. WMMD792]
MAGYREIAADLREAIAAGEYAPGAQIPTEHALAERYGVSRETVRRALAELRAAGVLESARAAGTRVAAPPVRLALARYAAVADPARTRANLGPWETACADQGIDGSVEVVSVEEAIPAPPGVAARLALPAGASMVLRRRRHLMDGRVVQLHESWMPRDLVAGTALAGQGKVVGGVYAALAAAGMRPATASEELSARPAALAEQSDLGLAAVGWVLELWRTTRDVTGRPLEALQVVSDARRVTYVYDDLPIRGER